LFGNLYNLYTEKKLLFLEHSANKTKTQNSIQPLTDSDLKDYENLLKWFHTSDKSIPKGTKALVAEVTNEAVDFITILNSEMVSLNELQYVALEDKKDIEGRDLTSQEIYRAITEAYKNIDPPEIANSCKKIFEGGSSVIPQGLTKHVPNKKLIKRSEVGDPKQRASLGFSIISSSNTLSKMASDESHLKDFWQFKPICHLFIKFDEILRERLKNKDQVKTINDVLTATFAPASFNINSSGDLVYSSGLYDSDPGLRIRALYIGLDNGSRISFPGTKSNKANQVLYNPADRPWFQHVHSDPEFQVGHCSLSKPYADIGNQLLIVRTIVCKGAIVSLHNLMKRFAFGIDLVINKSRSSINSDLDAIKSRLSITAEPFDELKFDMLNRESKNNNANSQNISKESSEHPTLTLIKNSQFLNVLDYIIENFRNDKKIYVLNDASIIIALIIIILGLFQIRSKQFIYARLVDSTLYGDVESSKSVTNLFYSISLNRLLSGGISTQNTTQKQREDKIQRMVRAKQKVNMLSGNSINISLLGVIIELPISLKFYQVEINQNSADSISISHAKDFGGNKISTSESIESREDLISALTLVTSEFEYPTVFIKKSLRISESSKRIIPSLINKFASVQKESDRERLFERKRIRIKTNHSELNYLFKKNSINVVNRLSDLASVLKRQPDQYFELLSNSNSDVKRYILCNDPDSLKEFENDHRDNLNKIRIKEKQTKSSIKLLVVPQLLGKNLFNTEHEQFILLENFVIVIEGFERVIARGGVEKDDTFISGYISWNEADLHYYRLFLKEVENFCSKQE
jgi:hypothetical protein